MKRTGWVLLFFALTIAVRGQSLLDERVSIVCEKMPLEEALFLLIDQSDIALSFSNRIIPSDKLVTISVRQVALRKVLDIFFRDTPLTYREAGRQIIITSSTGKKITVNGFVRDAETGENIIGAAVYDASLRAGTYTNEYGYFNLTFDTTNVHLTISGLGYEAVSLMVGKEHLHMDIRLQPAWLQPVLVSTYTDSFAINHSPDVLDINMKEAGRMTALGGEADLVRTAFALPGIQSGADGFGGLSVRGGDIDQNLFLLDGVPVYNAMHGIGLFSIYNSSAIRSAKILKGSFPARYGGRMSSVWDVQTKEGNKKELSGEVDVGITSLKLTLEGPLKKDKASFFFSGRRSLFDFYSEPISRRLRGNDGSVTYHFDDLNYKMNCDLSAKDRLYLSYYTGNDDYNDLRVLQRSLSDTTSMVNDSEKVSWGNKLAALRWNHIFSDKIFGNTTFTFSTYRYASQDLVEVLLSTPADTLNRDIILQLYASRIKDISLKSDFDYAKFQKHKIKFGGHFTRHEFSTKIATYEEASKIDFIDRDTIGDFSNQPVLTNEMAFYIEDEIRFNPRVHANLGLRISSSQVQNSWFVLPQPRLLLNYMPDSVLSCHLSLSRMVQYLHLLSPSRLGLPKDLWVTSTRMAPPQDSWQVTLGLNRRLNKGFSINVDLYYKRLYHQLFFKGPIDRINTLNWQEQVSVGKGRSFGGELLLLRQGKKWSGWLGYTLSRSDRRFPADINFGERFPIKLDRRHNLNIQFLYHGFDKWDVSAGFIIASGSFYSLPSQEYTIRQFTGLPTSIDPVPIPEGVNDRKLATYHRFDVSANYYLKGRTANHVLKIGVTNLYNRLNPLFRTIRDKFNDNGVLSNEFVEVSLLPLFPSLRYVMDLH